MRWRAFLLSVVLMAVAGKTAPVAVAHPTDAAQAYVWEGHWTATWDANGVYRVTERADFTVTVAFGGREAVRYSSGTAIMRVTEVGNGPANPCRTTASLPSNPITVPVRAAVRWALPSGQSDPSACDAVYRELDEARRLRDAYANPQLRTRAQLERWSIERYNQEVLRNAFGPGATEGTDYHAPMHTDPATCTHHVDYPEDYQNLPQVFFDADTAHEAVHEHTCSTLGPRNYTHAMEHPAGLGDEEAQAYDAKIRVLRDWLHDNCGLPPIPPRGRMSDRPTNEQAIHRWPDAWPDDVEGVMWFSIGAFTPIILPAQEHCPGGVGGSSKIPSVGTHGALCRTLLTPTRGCRAGDFYQPFAIPLSHLHARGNRIVETRDRGASGDIISRFSLEIEATGRCPDRVAWLLESRGSGQASSTIDGNPAPRLGSPVPVRATALVTESSGTLLETDDSGVLALQFADLSEVWLHPSTRVRVLSASCSPDTGMVIYLRAERGWIEIVWGGHLGGGIGYNRASSPAPFRITTTYHPEPHRSF